MGLSSFGPEQAHDLTHYVGPVLYSYPRPGNLNTPFWCSLKNSLICGEMVWAWAYFEAKQNREARTMARRSATHVKRDASFLGIFKSSKVAFAFGLIIMDALLVALIITYVPCKISTSFLFTDTDGFLSKCFIVMALLYYFQIPRLTGTLTCHRFFFTSFLLLIIRILVKSINNTS